MRIDLVFGCDVVEFAVFTVELVGRLFTDFNSNEEYMLLSDVAVSLALGGIFWPFCVVVFGIEKLLSLLTASSKSSNVRDEIAIAQFCVSRPLQSFLTYGQSAYPYTRLDKEIICFSFVHGGSLGHWTGRNRAVILQGLLNEKYERN